MKNCTKYVSPSQIRDVVGTPTIRHTNMYVRKIMNTNLGNIAKVVCALLHNLQLVAHSKLYT